MLVNEDDCSPLPRSTLYYGYRFAVLVLRIVLRQCTEMCALSASLREQERRGKLDVAVNVHVLSRNLGEGQLRLASTIGVVLNRSAEHWVL